MEMMQCAAPSGVTIACEQCGDEVSERDTEVDAFVRERTVRERQ